MSVSSKTTIIALSFLGVGFVVGLPMGALFDGADASVATARPDGAESTASGPSGNVGTPGARFHSVKARLANAGRGEKWDALLADTKAWVQSLNLADTHSLALAWLSEPQSNERTSLLRIVFARWMELEPSAARSAAESAHIERRLDALMGCLDKLCSVDFLSAWHRAESVADAELRKDLLRTFGWEASKTWDAAQAVRALARLAEKDRPEYMFDRAIDSWGKKNLGEALAFAQTLPTADRESALAELCKQALRLIAMKPYGWPAPSRARIKRRRRGAQRSVNGSPSIPIGRSARWKRYRWSSSNRTFGIASAHLSTCRRMPSGALPNACPKVIAMISVGVFFVMLLG